MIISELISILEKRKRLYGDLVIIVRDPGDYHTSIYEDQITSGHLGLEQVVFIGKGTY